MLWQKWYGYVIGVPMLGTKESKGDYQYQEDIDGR